MLPMRDSREISCNFTLVLLSSKKTKLAFGSVVQKRTHMVCFESTFYPLANRKSTVSLLRLAFMTAIQAALHGLIRWKVESKPFLAGSRVCVWVTMLTQTDKEIQKTKEMKLRSVRTYSTRTYIIPSSTAFYRFLFSSFEKQVRTLIHNLIWKRIENPHLLPSERPGSKRSS